MKRSEINQYIREAKAFMTKYHFMSVSYTHLTLPTKA